MHNGTQAEEGVVAARNVGSRADLRVVCPKTAEPDWNVTTLVLQPSVLPLCCFSPVAQAALEGSAVP